MCDCEELEFEDFQVVLDALSKRAEQKAVPEQVQVVTIPPARKTRQVGRGR